MFKKSAGMQGINDSLDGSIALGMIGLGNIGRLQERVVSTQQWLGFRVVAAADPTASRLEGLAPDAQRFHDYIELLNQAGVAAVSICTPPNTHYKIAASALASGKHVFLEKPPTLSLEECDALIKLAKEQERVFFMAYHTKYNPVVMAAQRELAGSTIRSINVEYKEYAHHYHDPAGWIFDQQVAGGGVLMDSGINVASVIAALAPSGQLIATEARIASIPGKAVETSALVHFQIGDQCTGMIDMDWMAPGREIRRFVVETDSDTYELDLVNGKLRKGSNPRAEDTTDGEARVDQHTEYAFAYADFALHLARRQSNGRARELEFILQAYEIAKME